MERLLSNLTTTTVTGQAALVHKITNISTEKVIASFQTCTVKQKRAVHFIRKVDALGLVGFGFMVRKQYYIIGIYDMNLLQFLALWFSIK